MERASKKAAKEGFTCLIIQLDTPGGLLSSTKEIVQQFLSPA
jgi:membrane-bound serine protease (ClpP class)